VKHLAEELTVGTDQDRVIASLMEEQLSGVDTSVMQDAGRADFDGAVRQGRRPVAGLTSVRDRSSGRRVDDGGRREDVVRLARELSRAVRGEEWLVVRSTRAR
jgi:hypothetical protein